MRSRLSIRRPKPPKYLLGAFVLAAVSGCQTTPTALQPPSLELLDSSVLQLAEGCAATGSYFVGFTVREDGRTDNLELPAGPVCVREALAAWVASFRYAPPGQSTLAGVEWLLVTAGRGS